MSVEHVISEEILNQAQIEFTSNNHWIAFNTLSYFLERGDVYFFKSRDEATEFADNNISEYDNYRVIYAESLKDLLLKIPYGKTQFDPNHLLTLNYIIMNEQNLQYLRDNIKYMGFGEKMNDLLETMLQKGMPEFSLTNKIEVSKKPFEVKLNFRKSDNSDMYFFNSYDASLTRSNGQKLDQTFYLNRGKGVTAKEAYNLLEGRSVFKELITKEGQPYNAWIQLDFEKKDNRNNYEVRQFHENYGYDVKAAVSKLTIVELTDAEKEKALIHSLQKGNIQSVSIEREGNVSKMFIEANPQYKTITLYDANMKRIQKEELSQYHSVDVSQRKEVIQHKKEDLKQDKKKELKQKPGDELDGSKKRKSRKKGLSP
jgi:hypothetical protein